MFSHHSHSGEFCGHALDTLEECVQQAIKLGMRTFALTEHMPRADERDLYPEEEIDGVTPASLTSLFASYYTAALALREKYKSQITLLIGFEVDYIRPNAALSEITSLRSQYAFDVFVGSVHHVNGIPVDYDDVLYNRAIRSVNDGGAWDWGVSRITPTNSTTPADAEKKEAEIDTKYTDATYTGTPMSPEEEELFVAYFDNQYSMLTSLKPPIIGHFDLIRLKCTDPFRPLPLNPRVWSTIRRNVSFIASYGGVVELNSAALRKGWSTPYPSRDVAELMMDAGVKFCLSDDSHGVKDVGYGYDKVVEYLEELGVDSIVYFEWEGMSRSLQDGTLESEDVDGDADTLTLPAIGRVVKREVKVKEVQQLMAAHAKREATGV